MDNQLSLYQPQGNSVVVYHSDDDSVELEVQLSDETVWLTQKQMAWLFDTTSQNITIHINNVYKEKELVKDATCKDFLQVQIEGGRSTRRNVKHYNLDVIISVGYRVKRQEVVCLLKDGNTQRRDIAVEYDTREQSPINFCQAN